jgi:hypothetical protein
VNLQRALILLLLGISLPAFAQEPQPAPGAVEELPTTTIYLKDEKGNLVPVPGFSYEHYRDLVLQAERSDTDPPPYAIEKLILKGTIDGDVCRIELEAVVHVRKAGWVMVPLRLSRAALRDAYSSSVDPKPASAAETTDVIHRFDAKEGHVVWLWGGKDRRHTLRFPLSTQLVRSAGDEQLLLSLPKASEARLTIDLPKAIDQAMLKTGGGLVETTSRDGRSQIAVMGATGELALAWQPQEMQSARVLDLDASSEIAVNVETRDTIGFSAKLHVSRAGGAVRRSFVRLPPESELVPRRARDFTTAVATAQDLSEAGFDPQRLASVVVARVDFEKPAESSDFTVEAVFKPAAASQGSAVESAGFEVLGAGRQTGFVSVYVPPGWSLKATPDAAVFRTDEAPTLLGQNRATARYRFVRQPFSLPLEIAPQPPRTVVEPTYIATVQPQRVTLSATLDYQVRGPRPAFVEINLADWRLDSAGPENIVDFETPTVDGIVRLNLQPGASGEFSLQLQLHRDVSADNLELEFGLPQAIATQALPATLFVTALDNVVLTPQNDDLRSLVAESRAPQLPAGVAGRTLAYRELPASAEPPRFVATCQVRKRRVTTTIEGRVQIGAQQADVEQNLSLQVAYEPLSVVTLDAPANASLADLRVTQNGQLLDVREESLGSTADVPTRRWRVELLEPGLGAVDLNVRYRLTLPEKDHLQLPLLAVAEEDGVVTARQQLTVTSAGAAQHTLIPRHQDDPGVSASETAQGTMLVWPRRAALLELDRTLAGRAAGPALTVERQWLQVWISPSSRRDRNVARIAGVDDQLRVVLPAGAAAGDITALIDGQPPRTLRLEGETLVIQVEPAEQAARTLELWYLMPGHASSLVPQQRILELSRINGAATPAQCWLQVLTPASEEVLYSPSPVTPEQSWRKRGWLWKRAGALTTRELEEWSGARQSEERAGETNDVLFMTLGQPVALTVVVWGTRWLWLCVAGGVLFAGILAHYLSSGRLVAVVAGLAAVALVATLMTPELMLSVSQYAGVGLLLLVAATWSLRVGGARPESAPPAVFASPAYRPGQPPSGSRSGRRGSSLTPSKKALTATTAEEARS